LAFAGIKTLIQKKLDKGKWNLGPITPGGIRLLTDTTGNLIGIVTVPVNPGDDPLIPNPSDAVDPFYLGGSLIQIPYLSTPKTLKNYVTLTSIITGVNSVVTFHEQDDSAAQGADYDVPSGSELHMLRLLTWITAASISYGIGYGDTGVAEGTTFPTTPKRFAQLISTDQLPLREETANKMFTRDIMYIIPAGKFPFLNKDVTTSTLSVQAFCIEVA